MRRSVNCPPRAHTNPDGGGDETVARTGGTDRDVGGCVDGGARRGFARRQGARGGLSHPADQSARRGGDGAVSDLLSRLRAVRNADFGRASGGHSEVFRRGCRARRGRSAGVRGGAQTEFCARGGGHRAVCGGDLSGGGIAGGARICGGLSLARARGRSGRAVLALPRYLLGGRRGASVRSHADRGAGGQADLRACGGLVRGAKRDGTRGVRSARGGDRLRTCRGGDDEGGVRQEVQFFRCPCR